MFPRSKEAVSKNVLAMSVSLKHSTPRYRNDEDPEPIIEMAAVDIMSAFA